MTVHMVARQADVDGKIPSHARLTVGYQNGYVVVTGHGLLIQQQSPEFVKAALLIIRVERGSNEAVSKFIGVSV